MEVALRTGLKKKKKNGEEGGSSSGHRVAKEVAFGNRVK